MIHTSLNAKKDTFLYVYIVVHNYSNDFKSRWIMHEQLEFKTRPILWTLGQMVAFFDYLVSFYFTLFHYDF